MEYPFGVEGTYHIKKNSSCFYGVPLECARSFVFNVPKFDMEPCTYTVRVFLLLFMFGCPLCRCSDCWYWSSLVFTCDGCSCAVHSTGSFILTVPVRGLRSLSVLVCVVDLTILFFYAFEALDQDVSSICRRNVHLLCVLLLAKQNMD